MYNSEKLNFHEIIIKSDKIIKCDTTQCEHLAHIPIFISTILGVCLKL